MEPVTVLTAAIGLIGILHIGNNIAQVLAKGKGAAATKTAARSDWYCFFRMSDLLGQASKPVERRERERKNSTHARHAENRRRAARRPRLYTT